MKHFFSFVGRKFFFSDVTALMREFRHRSMEKEDLKAVSSVNALVDTAEAYPPLASALPALRESPLRALLAYEKRSFLFLFAIHMTSVLAALSAALLAIQILKNFETESQGLRLVSLIATEPTATQSLLFSLVLIIAIFALNLVAASLYAQKIEREMLLSWRIPMRLMQYMYEQLLRVSKKDRSAFQTGEITNIAQNDARFIGDFLAHAFIDLPALVISCLVVLAVMFTSLGKAAWFGLFFMVLQVPLSFFWNWLGKILHTQLMVRSDRRLQKISDWIQGMRLVRYFGWGNSFQKEIAQATRAEFVQDLKLNVKYSVSFALTINWWMITSSGVFAGLLYFGGYYDAATVFTAVWLTGIVGQQLTPLPWFVNAWSQAVVAARRMRTFYALRLQEEEFPKANSLWQQNPTILSWAQRIAAGEPTKQASLSFSVQNVSLRLDKKGPWALQNISFEARANEILAVIGPVGGGKSVLLQLLMGDLTPDHGLVLLTAHGIFAKSDEKFSVIVPVHCPLGVQMLRAFQAYVPQEAFILNGSIADNVVFHKKTSETSDENKSRNEIMNALYAACFAEDLKNQREGELTDIGERGINLSGGQKQRISVARGVFSNASLLFLDDPLSAVDGETEKRMVENLFNSVWRQDKTIVWATHRLDFLAKADQILFIEDGFLVEQGSYQELAANTNSRLFRFVAGSEQ